MDNKCFYKNLDETIIDIFKLAKWILQFDL